MYSLRHFSFTRKWNRNHPLPELTLKSTKEASKTAIAAPLHNKKEYRGRGDMRLHLQSAYYENMRPEFRSPAHASKEKNEERRREERKGG